MTAAAAARQALAAVGSDLLAAAGPRDAQRWARLAADAAPPARCFRDLTDAPGWLRLPAPELAALARRTALTSMAVALAQSIDGALLKDIAEVCGEDALDAAIANADADDDQPPVEGAAITDRGFALLATAAPPALLGYLPPVAPAPVEVARVQGWIDRAMGPA